MADDLIISIPDANIPNPLPRPSVVMGTYNNGVPTTAFLTNTDISDWPIEAYVIQAWDNNQRKGKGYLQKGQTFGVGDVVEGTPDQPLNSEYFEFLRPLGNESGVATGFLDTVRWQGHPEAKWTDDDTRYQDSDSPFTIKFTRENIGADAPLWDNATQYFTGDYVQQPLGTTWVASQDSLNETPFGGSAFWDIQSNPGWGWRAEVISDDPLRDITARAIAIYSDPAWTAFLYTSGAFILDGGTGLYTSVTPDGQRTASPDPVYYSLLWGSLQEGNWQLIDQDAGDFEDRLHWMLDQGSAATMGLVQDVAGEVIMSQTDYSAPVFSPDGHEVIDLDSISSSRLVILLAGGAQDTLDPTLTIYLSTGAVIIPFTWQASMNRYRSGIVANIRDDILVNTGFKLAFELTWA